MSLEAPEEHTSHELLELVAAVLARTAELVPGEVPALILDLAVDEGPFDFGALYVPGATGALEYERGRGFPDELRPTLIRGFGAKDKLEQCRRDGEAVVLSAMDTIDDQGGGIEEALGADSALLIPLHRHPDECPVLLLAAILHDVSGAGGGLARSLQATVEFARSRHERLQRSLDAARRWDRLVAAVSEVLLFANPKGEIVQANAAAGELFGASPSDLEGRTVSSLLPGLSFRSEEWSGTANTAEGKERVAVRTAVLPADDEGNEVYLHAVKPLVLRTPDDVPFDAAGPLDGTTGLPDKEAFHAELLREMGLARKYNGWCSVLVLDLDGLSTVRQTLGDETVLLLRQLGETLQGRLRRSDRLGRMGKDGFGVLLSRSSREQSLEVANSLLDLVRERSRELGHPLTASIGISYFPEDAETADDLLEVAFGAMMLAKRGGGDSALVWTSELMATRTSGVRRSPSPRPSGKAAPDPPTQPPTPRTAADHVPPPPKDRRRDRQSDTAPVLPAIGRSFKRIGETQEGVEVPPASDPDAIEMPPDDDEEDVIEEALDMNNLVLEMPEDPSSEVG